MNPPAWLVVPLPPRKRSLRRPLLFAALLLFLLLEFQLYMGPNALLLSLLLSPVLPTYSAVRSVLLEHTTLAVGVLLITSGLLLLAYRQLRFLQWRMRTAMRGNFRPRPMGTPSTADAGALVYSPMGTGPFQRRPQAWWPMTAVVWVNGVRIRMFLMPDRRRRSHRSLQLNRLPSLTAEMNAEGLPPRERTTAPAEARTGSGHGRVRAAQHVWHGRRR